MIGGGRSVTGGGSTTGGGCSGPTRGDAGGPGLGPAAQCCGGPAAQCVQRGCRRRWASTLCAQSCARATLSCLLAHDARYWVVMLGCTPTHHDIVLWRWSTPRPRPEALPVQCKEQQWCVLAASSEHRRCTYAVQDLCKSMLHTLLQRGSENHQGALTQRGGTCASAVSSRLLWRAVQAPHEAARLAALGASAPGLPGRPQPRRRRQPRCGGRAPTPAARARGACGGGSGRRCRDGWRRGHRRRVGRRGANARDGGRRERRGRRGPARYACAGRSQAASRAGGIGGLLAPAPRVQHKPDVRVYMYDMAGGPACPTRAPQRIGWPAMHPTPGLGLHPTLLRAGRGAGGARAGLAGGALLLLALVAVAPGVARARAAPEFGRCVGRARGQHMPCRVPCEGPHGALVRAAHRRLRAARA